MEDNFEYNGQPLTKEEVIGMFQIPGFSNMEVKFSDEPPPDIERFGDIPFVLPNWTIYMCSDRQTKEVFTEITEDDANYWIVAVENKNPIAQFILEEA